MPYYYAVLNGHHPGIYLTWDECQQEVRGFSYAVYKKFSIKSEAESFLANKTSEKEISSTKTTIPNPIVPDDAVLIYTDGACQNQGAKPQSTWKGGYGYYVPSQDKKCYGPIPPPCTNNRAELTAIILAVSEFPKGKKIHIVTDSKYSYLIFTGTGVRYQSKGYRERGREVLNRDLVEQAVQLLDNYTLTFTHVFSHTGLTDEFSRGNAIADQLAVKGAETMVHPPSSP